MRYELIYSDIKIKQYDEEEKKWREIYYFKNIHVFLLQKQKNIDLYVDGNSTLGDLSLRLKFKAKKIRDNGNWIWISFEYNDTKYRIILRAKKRIDWTILYSFVTGGAYNG